VYDDVTYVYDDVTYVYDDAPQHRTQTLPQAQLNQTKLHHTKQPLKLSNRH